MIINNIEQRLLQTFEKQIVKEIILVSKFYEFSLGKKIIRLEQYINAIPFILKSSIKIMREDIAGKELMLY